MPQQDNIQKLRNARDKLADVYKDLATDSTPDDGNLTMLNESILKIQAVVKKIE